ncbi:MAG: putative zinc-binding metallopeptidase [Gemmatimonadaceae bacterium]
MNTEREWTDARRALLERRISDLGLSVDGTPVAPLVQQLYNELKASGLHFLPPVFLTDEWGCPSDTPIIGVPFYLADPSLRRIEAEFAGDVESELDSMRFLRHEAGHAYNYAYQLYDRADWRQIFGPYSRPYRDRFRVDPFSRDYVRHILGWYAQKHPDEDFAESFAVWLTPDCDWRSIYSGWPALSKLEYVDRLAREIGDTIPEAPLPTPDDLPVEHMHHTVAHHYAMSEPAFPLEDPTHFDGDLKNIFATLKEAPEGEGAASFLDRHHREIVTRIAYWTGESAQSVRAFADLLRSRAEALQLVVRGLDASTLIELTAFGTAVMMNVRHQGTAEPDADT